ncbi:cold-shock protein [Dongia deserti]|uniref:cold-shock protein n=1 Tax=Dongia deserti TaxID=2268030 RepID=UPI000E656479|nr:cold shock domain-containing protein [Dongia deserti]
MDKHQGTIVRWVSGRGFGFVEQPDGTQTFCHISAFAPGTQPDAGDTIEFTIARAPDGRFQAKDARIIASAEAA